MSNMLFANNANTTLTSSITTSATSITVASSAAFPSPINPQYFYCTLADSATQQIIEIIKVTAISGTTWTVVRGQDGTSGTAFSIGDIVSLRLVRASLNDFAKLDETNTFTQTITAPSLNVSGLTASSAVATDASKNLVSVTNTGTGNNVLATNPTITGLTFTSAATAAPAFSAYANAVTSVANSTFTKVAINTKEFDTNNNFDSATNYRFKPTVAGYYELNAAVTFATSATGYGITSIFFNGSEFKRGNSIPMSAGLNITTTASTLIYFDGSTSYAELYVYQNSGVTLNTFNGSPYVYFQASMVRSA